MRSNSSPGASPDPAEPLTLAQQAVLEAAIAKLVLLGEQVGVDSEQMILLLESGLSVGQLLEYLAALNGECFCAVTYPELLHQK